MAERPKGSKGWLKYNCRRAAGSEMDNVTVEMRKRAWMRLMRRFLEALACGSGLLGGIRVDFGTCMGWVDRYPAANKIRHVTVIAVSGWQPHRTYGLE